MKEFEFRYEWNDVEESCYRKTKSYKQIGGLKTRKLDNETDRDYQERTRNLINNFKNSIIRYDILIDNISIKFK